ncbi:calcium-binding protein [Solicola sp. PLA-1-18]|uniref:calcium-binding protein n=1 Tax=Solicola sp. PLA-1-18 TaxID=3380532 RepID=UPI003B791A0F
MARISISAGAALLATLAVAPTGAHAATPTCQGKRATIVGSTSVAAVKGTAGRDVIVGSGENTISARGGDDLVCSPGGDTISGGAGADSIVVTGGENFATRIAGGAGDDRITVAGLADSVRGDAGADRITTHGAVSQISGGDGNDRVDDTNGWAAAFGDAGDDVMVGGIGTTLVGGPGRDRNVARAASGTEQGVVMIDAPGPDSYDGNGDLQNTVSYYNATSPVRIDLAAGRTTGAGNGGRTDTLVDVRSAGGSSHADTILGTPQANRLWGLLPLDDVAVPPEGAGADLIAAGAGDDLVRAAGTGSRLWGQDGNDTIETGNTFSQTSGTTSYGGAGDDVLTVSGRAYGGPGDDTLVGDVWDDVLVGEAGRDTADGRDGTDLCSAETVTACEGTP